MTKMAKPLPSLIRAKMTGANAALLRLRMKHAMESGQRRDAQGRPSAAWHITDFTLLLNGKPLLSGQLGGGISQDPYFEVALKGVKAGDELQLDWTDTAGAKRSDRASIQPA